MRQLDPCQPSPEAGETSRIAQASTNLREFAENRAQPEARGTLEASDEIALLFQPLKYFEQVSKAVPWVLP